MCPRTLHNTIAVQITVEMKKNVFIYSICGTKKHVRGQSSLRGFSEGWKLSRGESGED